MIPYTEAVWIRSGGTIVISSLGLDIVRPRLVAFGNMISKRKALFLLLILIPAVLSGFTSPTKALLSPFWIEVTPETVIAKPGDTVSYHVKVDASPEFSNNLSFTLRVTALGFGFTLDMGSLHPPYPKEFDYSFNIPREISTDMTVRGVITATGKGWMHSDDTISYTKDVEIKIKSAPVGSALPNPNLFLLGLLAGGLATILVVFILFKKRTGTRGSIPTTPRPRSS